MTLEVISDGFIQKVRNELKEGKAIRYDLPEGGLLHVDRPLPYLVVYRYPLDPKERYTSYLVRSEASFIIASGHHSGDLQNLVRTITRTLSDHYGALLIVEIWKGSAETHVSMKQRLTFRTGLHPGQSPYPVKPEPVKAGTSPGTSSGTSPGASTESQKPPAKAGTSPDASTESQKPPAKAGTSPGASTESQKPPAKAGTSPDASTESQKPPAKAGTSPDASTESQKPPAKAGTPPASFTASSRADLSKPGAPVFRIMGPAEVSFSSVEYLKKYLEEMRLGVLPVTAVILKGKQRHPPDMPPLLEADELKELEALLIGVEVSSFYINPETGDSFPLMLRRLVDGFSKALRKTFYEFIRIQTKLPVRHYQMLGQRMVSESTWHIDESLAGIDDRFRFLLLVTPINISGAWRQFRESRFETIPEFHYRLMPLDPDVVKRDLYNIPVEQVEDPALSRLFRDKRHELDKILTLLGDRGKPDFILGSLQLYGRTDPSLLSISEGLLASVPPARPGEEQTMGPGSLMSPGEFAERARREISFYREQFPDIAAEVRVQDDIAGMIVSGGILYIGSDARIERESAEALIQHEVGTHILTYYNGRAQPLKQLYCGVPGYEELQEGLAVLSEYLVGGLTPSRLRLLAGRVMAVQSMVQGADFIETFRLLHRSYRFDEFEAFTTSMRVYRGGGLTKDAIYLKGLVHLLDWLREGRSLEPLLIGKIHEDYIPLMEELLHRKVLRPVPIRPRYLADHAALSRLEELKSGKSVMNLV